MLESDDISVTLNKAKRSAKQLWSNVMLSILKVSLRATILVGAEQEATLLSVADLSKN